MADGEKRENQGCRVKKGEEKKMYQNVVKWLRIVSFGDLNAKFFSQASPPQEEKDLKDLIRNRIYMYI